MKNLGVISQVSKYLIETFPFSQKRKDTPKFLDYQEEKLNSEFFKANWQIIFYRNPPILLTEQIKNAINTHFMQLIDDVTTENGELIKGYCGWVGSLLDLDHILSYFLYKTEIDQNHQLYKLVDEYCEFLRTECNIRNFKIPEPFGISAIKRYMDNQAHEIPRPPCPSCGSNKIVSSGVNWLCRSCGRAYRKNPRG